MAAMRTDSRDRVFRITLSGLMTAVMLVLGFIENQLPSFGVPGIKLGLSNGVLIFAVYMLDIPTAYILMCVKVGLSGLLFSGVSAMVYAFAGGLLSLTVMCILSRVRSLSPIAVSVAGGVAHNLGQVSMAVLIAHLPMQILYYLALLAAVGAVCGALTGFCAAMVMRHLKASGATLFRSGGGKPGWKLIVISLCAILAMIFLTVSTLRRPAAVIKSDDPPGGIRMLTTEELLLPSGQ